MSRETIADGPSEIDVETEERPYDGFRPVDRFRFRHRAAGEAEWQEPVSRQILRSPSIVAVLPFDPVAGRIVLIRQFRLSAHLVTGSGVLVEIVAGAVDAGENADTAARRELQEETGLEAQSLSRIAKFLSSPGIADEFVHLYAARVDVARLPARAGHDVNEVVFPFASTPEAAIAAADEGLIGNGFALLALNWLARHKDRLFPRS